jgi:hypothetical protein
MDTRICGWQQMRMKSFGQNYMAGLSIIKKSITACLPFTSTIIKKGCQPAALIF